MKLPHSAGATALALVGLLGLAAPVHAQDDPQEGHQDGVEQRVLRLELENAELGRRLDILTDELEIQDLGGLVPPVGASAFGMGPAASKVYAKESGLSIGGYGQGLYESPAGPGDTWDALRTVFYFGYKFDRHWVFNSEIELEHAGVGDDGEAAVEFATLDYVSGGAVNGRAGLALMPMGLLNEMHEPTTYLPSQRSLTESRIIPSTWRENAIGVFGDAGPISYRAYLAAGLDATGFTAEGLRGGRQEGSESMAEDLGIVLRADWTETPGVLVGGSWYCGDSGQGQAGTPDARTSIWEVHAETGWRGFSVRGLAARAEVDDVAALNSSLGLVGAASIGEELEGAYVELGYDLMTEIDPASGTSLSPFLRWETIDTQAAVPSGYASDPANDDEVLTFGVNWKPIDQIVVKLDYMDFDGGTDGWNFSVGYVF